MFQKQSNFFVVWCKCAAVASVGHMQLCDYGVEWKQQLWLMFLSSEFSSEFFKMMATKIHLLHTWIASIFYHIITSQNSLDFSVYWESSQSIGKILFSIYFNTVKQKWGTSLDRCTELSLVLNRAVTFIK